MAAFAPDCRVSSIAHVVALGHLEYEVADCCSPGGVFIIRYPASSTVVCGVGR
jgi:hypothetical protein